MAEDKGALQSAREWVVEHKLRAVGTLWLSGIVGSIAYNWSRPGMKTSVKIIHARIYSSLSGSTSQGWLLFRFYPEEDSFRGEKIIGSPCGCPILY